MGSQRVGRDRAREHTRIVLWFKRRRDTFSVKNLPPTSCYWPPASSPSAAVQRVCPLLPRCYALSLLVSQACLALCDPVACCPPGSSVPGMLQARILEWDAMPSSRGSSHPGIEPRSPALLEDTLPFEPLVCYLFTDILFTNNS